MQKKVIRVFIVDDSPVACELIAHILKEDPNLEVVGFAENGEKALKWLEKNSCDVVTMDIQMPFINGFEVTRRIMETKPIPIVIITSTYTQGNTDMAFKAIEVGALAILEKPHGFGHEAYIRQSADIINTIKVVAGIKLIKKRPYLFIPPEKETPPIKVENIQAEVQAIAIGASLGGPPAIVEILSQLPSNLPVPVFIVQHIAIGFTEGFVKWLQEHSHLPIKLGSDGEKALPGHVYVAPDSHHMEVKKDNTIVLIKSPINGPQPSVGRLFNSMALTYGASGVGVILTGMGRDGARELLVMKQHGAYTIAQDEASCIMFGMPREAIAIGAARNVLPLSKIPEALIELAFAHKNIRPRRNSNGKSKY